MSIGNVAQYFAQTATVMRPVFTRAVTGALISTLSSQSDVAGCLRPRTSTDIGGERLSADKVTLYASHRWYCATAADIRQDDRLVIGGTSYRVRFVADVMTMGRLQQIDLLEVGHDAG